MACDEPALGAADVERTRTAVSVRRERLGKGSVSGAAPDFVLAATRRGLSATSAASCTRSTACLDLAAVLSHASTSVHSTTTRRGEQHVDHASFLQRRCRADVAVIIKVASISLSQAHARSPTAHMSLGDQWKDFIVTCVEINSELGYPERIISETFVNLHAIEPTRTRRPRRVHRLETPRRRADAATETTSRRWRGRPKFDFHTDRREIYALVIASYHDVARTIFLVSAIY